MDNKKRNVQVESDGSRSALVPLWRELPQITVRLKEGNTIYRFTASFDGMHTLSSEWKPPIEKWPMRSKSCSSHNQ